MAKEKENETKLKKKKKLNPAVLVFNIIFIILAVILAVGIILMFVPSAASAVKGMLKGYGENAMNLAHKVEDWVSFHVCDNFGFTETFRGHGRAFTACMYILIMFMGALIGFYMIYLPFRLRSHNTKAGKKETYRKVLCWVASGVSLVVFTHILLLFWRKRLENGYSWWPKAFDSLRSLFAPNGALYGINLKFLTPNTSVNALIYLVLLTMIVEAILLIIACVPKAKTNPALEEEKTPLAEEEKAEEAKPQETTPVVPTPIAAEEAKKEEKPEEAAEAVKTPEAVQKTKPTTKVTPTIRELAILNSLEAISASPVENLPGTEENKAAEAVKDVDASTLEKPEEPTEKAEEALKDLQPKEEDVHVLPGIDETGAEPWEEEKKENKPVTIANNEIYPSDKRPQEEIHDAKVQEENAEDRSDKKQTIANNEHEEVKSPEVDAVEHWVLPAYVEEEKPAGAEEEPAEAEEKAVEEKTTEEKPAEEKKEETPAEPEKKPEEAKEAEAPKAEETKEEPKPVEKPVEEKKASAIPAPVGHKQRIQPHIIPVAPIEHEEEKPAEEAPKPEEKHLSALHGPLHPTNKSKHEKIQAVEAKHVKFELRNYQIKTYQGELTPEEAFAKGVTKVQPSVNPVFANEANEPAWKQKRREEEIRKNGYGDVTQIKDLKNNRTETINKPIAPVKAQSIRDLVKAKKAMEETEEAPKTEKTTQTPIKPIAPIKPVEVKKEEPKAEEPKRENPFHNENAPALHPLAPIAKKPQKRPEIKPVNIIKPKH